MVWTAANLGRGNPQIFYNQQQRQTQASYGEVFASLKAWEPGKSEQVLDALRADFARYPGARISIVTFENGPPIEAPVAIRITGENLEVLKALAARAEQIVKATPGTRDVENPLRLDRTDIDLGLDEAKAAALGMPAGAARRTARLALSGEETARFRDPDSDFASLHNLWRYLKDQQKALSHSAFRRMCRAEFLHYLRVREWQDLHAQLRSACKSMGIDPDQATADRDAVPAWDTIHRALLAGLLSQIGLWEEPKREYLGARGAKFAIAPGSTLFRKRPDYVMAAELVETSRLWARRVAPIDPQWAEDAAGHLVKRTVSEPRWSKRMGAVVASERVTLFGVPLAVDRTVQYGPIDPETARDLFIRRALVEGDWDSHHAFWKHNQRQLRGIADGQHDDPNRLRAVNC